MATSIGTGILEIPISIGECTTIMNLEIVILLEEEVVAVVEDTVEVHLTSEVGIMTGEIIEDMMVHMDMVTIPEDPQDRQFISLTTEGSGSLSVCMWRLKSFV